MKELKKVANELEQAINYHQKGQFQEAESIYKSILKKDPKNADVLHLLGVIACQTRRYEIGEEYIRQAIEVCPKGFYYNSLGLALLQMAKYKEALEEFEKSLKLEPNAPETHNNLGMLYQSRCQPELAIEYFRKAIELEENFSNHFSNYLICLHYLPKSDPSFISEEHKRWGNYWENKINVNVNGNGNGNNFKRTNSGCRKNTKMRIGYVSSDFCTHPVGFFIEPILKYHDKNNFEIYCYSDVIFEDEITERLKRYPYKWKDIHLTDNDELANEINKDEIDILVDLAGHYSGNRLLCFAQKPARIQATYLGYPNTTGLKSIDYRITDNIADPNGYDQYYTEKLVRLPGCFLCYEPPENKPKVNDLPYLKNRYITFGSCNNISKINKELIAVWSKILKEVPLSKLLIKSKPLYDKSLRDNFQALFQNNGIPPERLELIGYTETWQDHIMTYNRIDIALDTFPYNGTTTTCESLLMGVPVITVEGNSHVARVGKSILSSIGLSDFVGKSTDEYIEIAVDLSKQINLLNELRLNLYKMLDRSSLSKGKEFVEALENSYKRISDKEAK